MIKGAIFDVDGTILDSMPIWDTLSSDYIKSLGLVPEKDLDLKISNMSFKEGTEYIKKRYKLEKSEDEIKRDILNIVRDFYENRVPAKKGAVEYIKKLNNENTQMIITTSSDRKPVEKALERLGILKCFSEILTCSELNTNKRESFIYLKAAEKLNLQIPEIYVFEDADFAVESAKKAGFKTVAIYDRAFAEEEEKLKKTADLYIYDFTELMDK